MEFIAKSPTSQKLLNTLRVSANLPVNILIWGEPGTGKKTLASTVFKELTPISVEDIRSEVFEKKDLFIYDLHKCTHIDDLMKQLKGCRIIATANKYDEQYEEYFPVIIHLPSLKDRPQDLDALKKIYIQEAQKDFNTTINEDAIKIDLSENALSLKKSILTYAVLSNLDEEKLLEMLEKELEGRIEEGYKELLYLFEVPLLRAARRKFKSVLAISKALGLNRATVTSKINRYKDLIK